MITTLLAAFALAIAPADSDSVAARAASIPQCTVQSQFAFQVDRPAMLIQSSTAQGPRPTRVVPNPANLVQFVVDTTGHVVGKSFLSLRAADPALVKEAAAAAQAWRFIPATKDGCKVPQIVQTPISR